MDKEYKYVKRDHNDGIDSKDSTKPSNQDGQFPSTSTDRHNLEGKASSDVVVQHTLKISRDVSETLQCGTEDMAKLLGIFPEEIWEMVLDHLDDPSHFASLSSSSPYFKHFVERRKVLYLFPQVWEILAEKYESENEYDGSYNQAIMDDDPSTRMSGYKRAVGTCYACGGAKYVQWFSGILNMRSVCRKWNDTIDGYFQKMLQTTSYPPVAAFHNGLQAIYHDRAGEWKTKAGRFVPHFSKTHLTRGARSPFVGRTVELGLNFEAEHQPEHNLYVIGMIQILTEFGRHVWHCAIFASGTGDTSTALYLKIREVLSLMPNLKTISLTLRPPPFLQEVAYTAQQLTQLRSLISANPMARINQLDRLLIDTPAPIANHMLRSIGNVPRVRWNVPKEFGDEDLQLTNVRQLSLKFDTELDFQNFFRLAEQCQPEKLSFYFEHELFIDWWEVFNVIEASVRKKRLTHVAIDLPVARQVDEMEQIASAGTLLRLNISGVTHLTLKFENFASLDFILPMRETLETLVVSIDLYRWGWDEEFAKKLHVAAGKDQAIDFIGYFERPLESNIWTIFQKLNLFHFHSMSNWHIDPQGQWRVAWCHYRKDWLRQQKRNQIKGTV